MLYNAGMKRERLICWIGIVLCAVGLVARADFDVYFMRHGETPWNRAKVVQGSVPYVDITDVGVGMAQDSAKAFRREGIVFDRIYTSPYLRARHTAEIIAADQGLKPLEDARIRERDCVTCEGLRYGSGEELSALMQKGVGAGNESVEAVGDRAMAFLEKELAPLDGKVKRVLCVGHTVLLNIIEARLLGCGKLQKVLLPNCCVHVIAFRNGHFEMKERARTFYDPARYAGRTKQRRTWSGAADGRVTPETLRTAVARQSDIVKLELQKAGDAVAVVGPHPVPQIFRLDEALQIARPVPEFEIGFRDFDSAFAERVLSVFRAQKIHESRIRLGVSSPEVLDYFQNHHPGIRRAGK